jgi:hypothetical protein
LGSPSIYHNRHYPFLALLHCAKKSISLLLGPSMYTRRRRRRRGKGNIKKKQN